MSTYSKTFGLTFINDDHFYANVAIIQNFFNGLCRILWGYGYDRFNFKICFMVIAFVATLVTSCLPLLPNGRCKVGTNIPLPLSLHCGIKKCGTNILKFQYIRVA